MSKKSSNRFERAERTREKAAKKAARLVARRERVAVKKDMETVPPPGGPPKD